MTLSTALKEAQNKVIGLVKQWCMDNKPYYKKYIPDVVNYFYSKIK